jgi:endonuclease/exonuclease/phosphatase family metal-dependent hydrolase
MTAALAVASYNIHKGFTAFNRRLMVHELRERLHSLNVDIVFLQEVQGNHQGHARRMVLWPDKPQHEFLAGSLWTAFAYGKNAVYQEGDHGNAILSRFPILSWENLDISSHPFESRGLLHCVVQPPGWGQALHCINVHLALTESGRKRQLAMIVARIRAAVPRGEPLILAGDFNDWRARASGELLRVLGLRDVFELTQGRPARSYPAALPMLTLDRIYVAGLGVRQAQVHAGPTWRHLSDHAALTATLFPASSA